MSMTDISKKAVERLADVHQDKVDGTVRGGFHGETAATLRALTAERDALRTAGERIADALDNLTIAIGMGWDLNGVLSESRAALTEWENLK